ncbi:hypothetical protein Tco_0568424 [Tanacetum coccineum]
MHNNIMAAVSRERPPMLCYRRYAQWRSRILRYIDTSPNGEAIRKCNSQRSYTQTIDPTPAFPQQRILQPVLNKTTVETDPEKLRGKDMQKKLTLHAKNQGSVDVVGAMETVGPKLFKDRTYHKEKMLLCKQAEKGVQLQAEQSDWLADTDEEIDEQELEAHYSYMAKIQEVPNADSGTDVEPLE